MEEKDYTTVYTTKAINLNDGKEYTLNFTIPTYKPVVKKYTIIDKIKWYIKAIKYGLDNYGE